MKVLFVTAAIISWIGNAQTSLAAEAVVQTPSPVIHLKDNLDEADGLGWCIDTIGRGLSNQLHAHSCKPQGGDVQFRFDPQSGQIASVAFDGLCATFTGSVPIGLIDCDASNAQRFSYDIDAMTFSPVSDPDTCLAVGAASRSAGPFMSRDLDVVACDAVDDALKTWVVRP